MKEDDRKMMRRNILDFSFNKISTFLESFERFFFCSVRRIEIECSNLVDKLKFC